MNKRIALFFLCDVRFGGFVSYTSHLVRTFEAAGWSACLYKIGANTEAKMREFNGPVRYRNIALVDALSVAQNTPTIITAAYWKQYGEAIRQLLRFKASIVLHDPTEYDPALLRAIRKCGTKVVSIRKCNVANLLALDVPSVYIPHPYQPVDVTRPQTLVSAVSLSRIDFDKHTEIIAKANALLEQNRRVRIYGELNRLYAFHKLNAECPEWEQDYCGRFALTWDAAVRRAASAEYVVDMSAIAKDGGGTQYTFLEAWNAGADLILNRKWVDGVADAPVKDAALFAGDEHELADLLSGEGKKGRNSRAQAAQELLKSHSPQVIYPHYENFLTADSARL